jgi:hypothetical protein
VEERLGLFAQDGFNQNHWNKVDLEGTVDTGLASTATTSGAILRITLQSAESYLLQVLPLAGGNPIYSASGSLANTGAGSIDTIEILMYGNGSGNGQTGATASPTGQREFFFDKLSIDDPTATLAGDYNRDGKVDAADFTLWRKTLNQSVTQGSGADGDHDGLVTQADYTIWRRNYAWSLGSGTSLTAPAVSVPEGDCRAVIGLLSLVWFFKRSRPL